MIKKFCVVVFLFFSLSISTYAIDTSARAAVLMTADTREIIYAKNEFKKLSMASTTKIMTSLLAIEHGDLHRQIKVSEDMVSVEGTSMGLLPGDTVSLKSLVYGMLLSSGNDAANVTASVIGKTSENFAKLMNKRAKEIGMNNTNFVTPSGLDDENHYSCAYDMALLGASAIKNPVFKSICSVSSARISYGNPPYMRTLTNHNKLLKNLEGCFGIKTGFTKKSGRCLVSACEKEGKTLVCVTLGDPNDWYDHKKLYDYGFSLVKTKQTQKENFSVSVLGAEKKTLSCSSGKTNMSFYENDNFTKRVYLKKYLFAPVKKGDIVGEIIYSSGKHQVARIPIEANEDISSIKACKKEDIFTKIKHFFKGDKND